MQEKPFTVLISSAGRRVELLRIWRTAIEASGRTARLIAADMTALSAAWQSADAGYLVPRCQDPSFLEAVLGICGKEHVDLIVPTIDPELPVYAAAGRQFEAVGTRVHVSSPETISISNDKRLTHAWLLAHGLPTVAQVDAQLLLAGQAQLDLPVYAKPARGSSAIGVTRVDTLDSLERIAAHRDDYIVQEIAPGAEYTVDVFVDRFGRCRSAVPRRRLEVRNGEVSKGVTVKHQAVIALATQVSEALPGAWGCLNVQIFADDLTARLSVIEINARFGGGFPLSWEAGADIPRWILEDMLSQESSAHQDWKDGLLMLRYDAAVFRDKAACGL